MPLSSSAGLVSGLLLREEVEGGRFGREEGGREERGRRAHSPPAWVTAQYELPSPFPVC